MFRPNFRAIFRLIFEQVERKLIMLSIENIINFRIHMFKDQSEDGFTNRAETFSWNYNRI